MLTMDRVYSAEVWARQVKKISNFACAHCGSGEDVQATHVRAPSMGGKNTLENGIALCVICRSRKILISHRLRLNFSIPKSLKGRLDTYCHSSGRSVPDIVKQLLADFIFDSTFQKNGFHEDALKNEERVFVLVLDSVYAEFVKKCSVLRIPPKDVMKSMMHHYLDKFSGGNS